MIPEASSSPGDGGIRKRVCKACNRCRFKKSKCDGLSPCSRCRADNAICVFGERKKSQDKVYPKGYVAMLESQQTQLVSGLQELYRRLQGGEGWVGSPLKESMRGMPLTHDILERLGALKQENNPGTDHFEDDYDVLQNPLSTNGAGAMQREPSFNTDSDLDRSPAFDFTGRQRMPSYPNHFVGAQFPPTPPMGSPHQYSKKASSPRQVEMSVSTTSVTNQDQWQMDPTDLSAAEYDMTYESPFSDTQMQSFAFTQQMYNNAAISAINPCVTMKQRPAQDDPVQPYLSNTLT